MNITSKQIRAVLVVNLLALGLAACSSSPAPWSRPDTSPWSDKRSTAAGAAPADDIVVQEPAKFEAISEPIQYEPVVESAPMVPPPPSYSARSVVSDINNEQQIMSLPGNYYAVQAYAGTTIDSVEQFKSDHMLDQMLTVRTDRNGSDMYVAIEVHETRGAAQSAAAEIESKSGSKPWIRSVAGLQKIIKQ